MKKRSMMFAVVLAVGMGMSMPALAEEAPSQSEEGGLGGLLSSLLSEGGVVDQVLNDTGAAEAISGLFGEDGELSGILPENVDIGEVLQTVGDQLQDTSSSLYQGINSIAEMAKGEDGSIDWDKVGNSVGTLIDMFAGGNMSGTDEMSGEDMDAYLAELLRPYEEADAVMFDYLAERNAEFMDSGDAQVFSKTTAYIDDLEQDEVKVLGDFTQVNFAIEGNQMNMVSAATDTLLLTLTKGEDGKFTVTGEKRAEDGEGYAASLEAMCQEVGIPTDDFYASNVLGAYSDAEALAKYLDEHPEVVSAEFQGEQLTAEELHALRKNYTDELFDSLFEEEETTEAVTE